jgi:hypothetical protein
MITVKKGDFKIKTTKQVFEEQLRPLGYQLASKENEGAAEEVAPFVKKEEVEVKAKEKSEKAEEKALDEEFGFKKGKKGSK